MSHNRTTTYSAPFRRNSLLSLHQYAASDQFMSLGVWDRARMEDLYVVRGTVGRASPVQIMIVGVISSDKAYLQPHGNYDPTFMQTPEVLAKKAKLQFVICSPADNPEFAADYDLGIDRLKAIQEDVAGSNSRRDHFIDGHSLKMNFHLFSEKEDDDGANDAESTTSNDGMTSSSEEEGGISEADKEIYEVSSSYRHAWEAASETHHNNIMEVYGTNETRIDYRQFQKYLTSGTTVVVTFSLKHYGIREKGTSSIVSDTYSACVASVSILREAEKKIRQNPSSTPKRRPLPVSQTPSRKTLKMAADTFSPVRTRNEASVTASKQARGFKGASSLSPNPLLASTSSPPTRAVLVSSPSTALSPSSPSCAPATITNDMIERMIPLLLERMKNGQNHALLGGAETPSDRHRSSSPAVGSQSVVSADDTASSGTSATLSEASSERVRMADGIAGSVDGTWVEVVGEGGAGTVSGTAASVGQSVDSVGLRDSTAEPSSGDPHGDSSLGEFSIIDGEETLTMSAEPAPSNNKRTKGSSASEKKDGRKRRA